MSNYGAKQAWKQFLSAAGGKSEQLRMSGMRTDRSFKKFVSKLGLRDWIPAFAGMTVFDELEMTVEKEDRYRQDYIPMAK